MTEEVGRRLIDGVWVTNVEAQSGGGGGSQTLAQVLTTGRDGGAIGMGNVGDIDTAGGEVSTVGGDITTQGGTIDSGGGDINSTSGDVNTAGGDVNTTNGAVNTGGGDVNTAGGTLALGAGTITADGFDVANIPTADEKAALDAANAPDAGNAFATIADIPGGGSSWQSGSGPPGAGVDETGFIGQTGENAPTSGAFKVHVNDGVGDEETTGSLNYNVASADFIAALDALPLLTGSVQTPSGYEGFDLTAGGLWVQFVGGLADQPINTPGGPWTITVVESTLDQPVGWSTDTPGSPATGGTAGDRYLDIDSLTAGAGAIYTYTGSEWIQAAAA